MVESWKVCALGNLPSVHENAGFASIVDGMAMNIIPRRTSSAG